MTANPTLICCAHGTRGAAGRGAIGALIAAVRTELPQLRVRAAFVDVQGPSIAAVVQQVTATGPAIVVPLLLSSGYHLGVDIARAVRGAPAVAAPALGPDPRLTQLLWDRLQATALTPEDVLLLAAAGSSTPQSALDVANIAEQLAARHPGPLLVGYGASREPRVPQAVQSARDRYPGRRVVIASYLLAPGFFHDRLGQAGADALTGPLLSSTAVDSKVVQIVADRYRAALTTAALAKS